MPDEAAHDVRKGMPDTVLGKEDFVRRYRERFTDPAFTAVETELTRVIDVAWEAYANHRKAPRTSPAGDGFADPAYALSDDWRESSRRVAEAKRLQADPKAKPRVLIINGSSRNEHTCPGEMSKSYRLAKLAEEEIGMDGEITVDFLDLSRLTAEFGRVIYPCKSCVSTAMPLCHWPCSCYPNHGLGQVNDWMAEIYPMWTAAHGVMIVAPVNWYQASSALKLMIDRLVCADGGNPDPTSTHGKKAEEAKALELAGWPYPRHLAGRVFSVVVHGDTVGAEELKRNLAAWLEDMGLIQAGHLAAIGRYIGYYEPYATSHAALDADSRVQEEVRTAAHALAEGVRMLRRGELKVPGGDLTEPVQK